GRSTGYRKCSAKVPRGACPGPSGGDGRDLYAPAQAWGQSSAAGALKTMKITRLLAYRVELPLREGSYKWSGGKAVSVFDSTIVEIQTDTGFTGYGEVCPLGPFYLPAYAA